MINDFVKPLLVGLIIMAMMAGVIWLVFTFPLVTSIVGWLTAVLFIGTVALIIGTIALNDNNDEDSHGA